MSVGIPSVALRLSRIVSFWTKRRDEFVPSKFIKTFEQLFRLHGIEELVDNADVALNCLFLSEVEYEVRLEKQFNQYVANCRWPGHPTWIQAKGKTETIAIKGVALQALKIVLAKEFNLYCGITSSFVRQGITAKDLKQALLPLVPKSREVSTSVPSFYCPQLCSKVDGYFDESILNCDPRQLSAKEKEDVIFNFWVQTSRVKFPQTFNLFNHRSRVTERNCLSAFMVLFSPGVRVNKPGVVWTWSKVTNHNTCHTLVLCTWNDDCGRTFSTTGVDRDFNLARNEAARKALLMILGDLDFRILVYVTGPCFYLSDAEANAVKVRLESNIPSLEQQRTMRRKDCDTVVTTATPEVANASMVCPKLNRSHVVPRPDLLPIFQPISPPINHIPPQPQLYRPFLPVGFNIRPPRQQHPFGVSPRPHIVQPPRLHFGLARYPRSQLDKNPTRLLQEAAAPVRTDNAAPETWTIPLQPPPSATPHQTVAVEPEPSQACVHTSSDNSENDADRILMNPFAECFSTSEDGSLPIPKLSSKKSSWDLEKSDEENDLWYCSEEEDPIYLPFDKVIGYVFPEEAVIALDLLFEGRKEPGPTYDVNKYVLAECHVGCRVFRALGKTEKDAQEAAANLALCFLKHGD